MRRSIENVAGTHALTPISLTHPALQFEIPFDPDTDNGSPINSQLGSISSIQAAVSGAADVSLGAPSESI